MIGQDPCDGMDVHAASTTTKTTIEVVMVMIQWSLVLRHGRQSLLEPLWCRVAMVPGR